MSRRTAVFLVSTLSILSADAHAASYRCPKPDGTLWPGWHAHCPDPSQDPNTWEPPQKTLPRCDFGTTELQSYSACQQAVEDLAKYSVRWTDGLLETKFPRATCLAPGRPEIMLSGDRLELQNGFGAWQRHVYRCVWDPVARKVITAEAAPR